jgi:hypothetical protein
VPPPKQIANKESRAIFNARTSQENPASASRDESISSSSATEARDEEIRLGVARVAIVTVAKTAFYGATRQGILPSPW